MQVAGPLDGTGLNFVRASKAPREKGGFGCAVMRGGESRVAKRGTKVRCWWEYSVKEESLCIQRSLNPVADLHSGSNTIHRSVGL